MFVNVQFTQDVQTRVEDLHAVVHVQVLHDLAIQRLVLVLLPEEVRFIQDIGVQVHVTSLKATDMEIYEPTADMHIYGITSTNSALTSINKRPISLEMSFCE